MSSPDARSWLYPVEGMHEYRPGFLCLPECPPTVMSWMENDLDLGQGDVLICNYPGAGIVWLQEVLWLMRHPDQVGTDRAIRQTIGKRVVFLEHQWFDKDPKDILKDYPPPRLYKTHVPAHFIRHHLDKKMAKVIVWIADPRTCLVRYHNLYNTGGVKLQGFKPIDWDNFYQLFNEKQLFEGDWFDMYKSYSGFLEDPENVMLLKAEDVAFDPIGNVLKLADFVGCQLPRDTLSRIACLEQMDQTPDWRSTFSEEQMENFNENYKMSTLDTPFENMYV